LRSIGVYLGAASRPTHLLPAGGPATIPRYSNNCRGTLWSLRHLILDSRVPAPRVPGGVPDSVGPARPPQPAYKHQMATDVKAAQASQLHGQACTGKQVARAAA